MKYYLKLINAEKLEVDKDEFDDWYHKLRGGIIILKTKIATIAIKHEQILLGYILNDNEKGDE